MQAIEEQPCFRLGLFKLTDQDAAGHTLALGSTGSGKSLMIRIMMQDVLPLVGRGIGYRALVYDAKQDTLPILSAYCDPSLIKTLNPYDTRGYCWWIAKDCRRNAVTMEISSTLIPEISEQNGFFRNAARILVWGIMSSFTLSKLDWSFGDLLRALRSMETCRRILQRHPQTRHVVSNYFGREQLILDIQATIAATLMRFEPIAAGWDVAHRDGKRLSIVDAMESEQIIILANTEESREATDCMNRCVFKRWTDLILSQPDRTFKRFWTIIDELSEAGPLPSIVPLLKKSRSKGGRVVIATQSTSGLQDAKLYGEATTRDMLSCLSNRFVGRLECPYTAEYQSQYVGDQEIEQVSKSVSSSPQGKTESTNFNRVIQRTVLASEYMAVPPCDLETGLVGQFKLRSTPACWDSIDPHTLFGEMLIPAAEGVADCILRDESTEYLMPWTTEQEHYFAPITEVPSEFDTNVDDFIP